MIDLSGLVRKLMLMEHSSELMKKSPTRRNRADEGFVGFALGSDDCKNDVALGWMNNLLQVTKSPKNIPQHY